MSSMKRFFDTAKQRMGEVAANLSIPIPITASQLEALLKKLPIEGVGEVSVTIDETVRITGKIRKLLTRIPFEIQIVPVAADGRKLTFQISHFSPLNMEWVKKAVFQRHPHLAYRDNWAVLDLNEIEAVRKIPIGSVKSFEIKEGRLWVDLSK